MSRRPPSARDPRNVGITRTIPAVNRATKGASATRLASPLARPLPDAKVAPGSGVGGWTPELMITGYARVTTNVAPPGLRVPVPCTLTAAYLRLGTAPTGASLILLVRRSGSTLATLTIAAAGTSTSSIGLSIALAAGDIITFDVTQIGSTIAGADLAVQLVGS